MVRAAPALAPALAPAWEPRPRPGAAWFVPKLTKPSPLLCRTLSGDDDGMPFGAPPHLGLDAPFNPLVCHCWNPMMCAGALARIANETPLMTVRQIARPSLSYFELL